MKRVFCLLLIMLLMVGLLPAQAMAEGTDANEEVVNIYIHWRTEGGIDLPSDYMQVKYGETVFIKAPSGMKIVGLDPRGDTTLDIDTNNWSFVVPDSKAYATLIVAPDDGGSGGNELQPVEYDVAVSPVENGTLSVSPTKAKKGDVITVTATAAEGYELESISVKDTADNAITVTEGSFTMPESSVTVSASFKAKENAEPGAASHNITIASTENGTVTVSSNPALKGSTVTVTATAEDGYEQESITVIGAGNKAVELTDNSFVMPDCGVTVTVTFKQKAPAEPVVVKYAVTVSTSENGTLSVSTDEAAEGDTVTVTTASPKEGYKLDKIEYSYNGVKTDITESKSFTMPAGPVTVEASFVSEEPEDDGLTFEYAYDVQRSPSYPKKNQSFTVSGHNLPLDASKNRCDSNEGPWTLTNVGKYKTFKSSPACPSNLPNIASGISDQYNVSADSLSIYQLTRNGAHITYGILVMHNPAEQTAFFIGSNWHGSGAGYLFSDYAQSGSKTYNVTLDVTDDASPTEPDSGIKVSFDPNSGSCDSTGRDLSTGGSLDKLPEASRDGFMFAGWYTQDGKPVTENTVFNENTTIYAHWFEVKHTTNKNTNHLNMGVDLSDEKVLDMLVDEKELEAKENIYVSLVATEMTTVPEADKKAIEAEAGKKTIAAYMDIKLLKQTGGTTAPVEQLKSGSSLPVTIVLSDELIPANASADTFSIIHYHGNSAETIPAKFDPATKVLSFETDSFSTYALAYTKPSRATTWGAAGTVSNAATLDKLPRAGDGSGLGCWTILLVGSSIMLAVLVIHDRKRAK